MNYSNISPVVDDQSMLKDDSILNKFDTSVQENPLFIIIFLIKNIK